MHETGSKTFTFFFAGKSKMENKTLNIEELKKFFNTDAYGIVIQEYDIQNDIEALHWWSDVATNGDIFNFRDIIHLICIHNTYIHIAAQG